MAKEKNANKAGKARMGMQTCFILCCLVPLLCGMLILSIIAYNNMKSEMLTLMEEKLSATCSLLDQYFGCDYTEWCDGMGLSLTGTDEEWAKAPEYAKSDLEMIDSVKKEGIEMTVFKGNKRFLSSITNDAGERVYGTEADAAIYADVMKGYTHVAQNVVINGKDYMVCYKPLRNMDGKGEVVGMVFAGILEENFNKACNKLLLVILIVLIACVAIFAVIGVVVAKAVAAPLNKVVNVTRDLSEGDLSSDTNISSILTETNTLVDAVKVLQGNLYEIVSNIRSTSGTLSTNVNETNGLCNSSDDGAKQISGAVDELARATQSMAENVQNLAMNMGDIANSIEQINNATDELKSTTTVIEEVSDEAKKDIVSVAESAQTSVEAVNNINEHMTELSRALDEINQATELIANISSQTALLSLNASIEAARAGEAGRGFSVVASEISKLAEQSDAGTKQIDEVTRRVLALSEQSMKLTREITDVIKDEQIKVKATEDSFLKLKEQIDISLAQIASISEDITVLNEAKDQANSAVADLSAISEENAASNEEVTASVTNLAANIGDIAGRSNDMAEMSDKLIDVIKVFK